MINFNIHLSGTVQLLKCIEVSSYVSELSWASN
jgi:hypothetical protein